jgi:hypothetical protein
MTSQSQVRRINAELAKDGAAPRTISASTVVTSALPALILATLCLLPYLNKAFLIDDPEYLTMARQIVKHPMHPMDFDICWNTIESCTKLYLLTPGNSLMGYVLVPTVLAGAHEWMAHLTQLVLVWIAVVAMTSLIFRLGWDRWHATAGALLLVALPPFLSMASTAMPDILATAIALVAMERLAAWKVEQKWSQGLASAIALGLAGFARPHLVLLLPLAAFFLMKSLDLREVMEQIRTRFWLWIPVLGGGCLLLAMILAVREHNLALSPPSVVTGVQHIQANLYAFLLYFAFPLPLAACWVANTLNARRLLLVSILSLITIVPWLLRYSHSFVPFLVVFGGGAIADLLFRALKEREHTDLFLMLWILIPLPIVYYSHLPMKYLLPCVPAVIFLCFRLLDGVSVQFARTAAFVVIGASTGYSLLILHADAEFANFARGALNSLINPHVAKGERVWFGGQYWSYWYAPLAGAKLTFEGGPQPEPGDLLVVDVFAAEGHSPAKRFPHRTLIETIPHKYRFGRTMGAGVGLYSNGSGYWLWGFGETEEDRFELWRID